MGTRDVATPSQALQNYGEKFSEAHKALRAGPRWLHALRQSGFDRFNEVGFPTTHDEDWRFTNISEIAKSTFDLAPEGGAFPAVEGLSLRFPRARRRLPACFLSTDVSLPNSPC